ncbi:MAG: carbon-nitrogen hydrolase family protein [Gemmataceae bacterium]
MRIVVLLGLSGGLLGLAVAWAPPSAPAPAPRQLRVAAVQMRSKPDLEANLVRTAALLKEAAARKAQVAVFPECSASGYFNDYTPKLNAAQLADAEKRLSDACRDAGIWAILGLPVRAGKKLYNSALVIDDTGRIRERYHKIQLAEPWPDPGDHLSVFRVHGVPCSIIICHDERYPELVRLPVLAGARVVFYLSHESPLTQEHKVGPYRAQIQARAVENSVFVVHANAPANPDASGSHGQSRIIDPDGNLMQEASLFREEMLVETLELSRATAANAQRSLTGGVLGAWWREGLKHVRHID